MSAAELPALFCCLLPSSDVLLFDSSATLQWISVAQVSMFFLANDCHGSLVAISCFISAALVFGFFFLEIIPPNCSPPHPLCSKNSLLTVCVVPALEGPHLVPMRHLGPTAAALLIAAWVGSALLHIKPVLASSMVSLNAFPAQHREGGQVGFRLCLSPSSLPVTKQQLCSPHTHSLCLKPEAVCGCITPCCVGAQHKEQSSHCTVLLPCSAHAFLATDDDSWQCLGLLQCIAQLH